MKMFCLIALVAVTAGTTARAQSNTNTTPQSLRVKDIYSDSADFDGNSHTVTNRGNVRVIASDMKLNCALLITALPESGGRVSHIVAETNVVIDVTDSKGQTAHATGDKAVYNYNVENGVTNETVTLTALPGNPQPRVEDAQGTQTADVIIWNRANNSFHVTGNYHFEPKLNNSPAATNAPAAMTNELTATNKMDLPPGADTNFPPGKTDLAPQRHVDTPPPQALQPKLPH
jgi:lipopolysaccharide export system protein LptA